MSHEVWQDPGGGQHSHPASITLLELYTKSRWVNRPGPYSKRSWVCQAPCGEEKPPDPPRTRTRRPEPVAALMRQGLHGGRPHDLGETLFLEQNANQKT